MKTIELLRLFIFTCIGLSFLGCASPLKKEPVVGVNEKVSVEYTLTLDDGTVVDSNVGKAPLVYQAGQKQIMPALEQALVGMKVDETKEVKLTPAQAYGPVDPRKLQRAKPEEIPAESRKVGAVIGATVTNPQDPQGEPVTLQGLVREVNRDQIIVDFNHPLAGQNLNFDVRILAIEPVAATE